MFPLACYFAFIGIGAAIDHREELFLSLEQPRVSAYCDLRVCSLQAAGFEWCDVRRRTADGLGGLEPRARCSWLQLALREGTSIEDRG